MTAFIAKTATHTVTTTPAENGGAESPTSIRQIMRQGIINGVPKDETEALIKKYHASSAACSKFGVHYSWYKGKIKKEGLLPVQVNNAAILEGDTLEGLQLRMAILQQLIDEKKIEREIDAIQSLVEPEEIEMDPIEKAARAMAEAVDRALEAAE